MPSLLRAGKPALFARISILFVAALALAWTGGVAAAPPAACKCGCGGTPRPFCAHRCDGKPCTGNKTAPDDSTPSTTSAAATCGCGCKGTPRPACAHVCDGNPCTGKSIKNSRLIVGQVVENQPASFSLVGSNGNSLTGYVVEFDDGQRVTTDEKGMGTFTPKARKVLAKVADVTSTPLSVIGGKEAGEQQSSVPRYLALGNQLIVTKNDLFDGDAGNSKVRLGDQPCSVLAESPSQAVIYVPDNVGVGTKELVIEDKGRLEQPLSTVQILMNADQLKLKKGESTRGSVVIEGADASLAGGLLRIQNLSPDTVTVHAPGATNRGDTLELKLTAAMVSEGRIEVPLQIQAKKGGSFTLLSSIADPNQKAATCTCGCKGTPRPACAHSCGGDPCTGSALRE
jgi:hypothetical protein